MSHECSSALGCLPAPNSGRSGSSLELCIGRVELYVVKGVEPLCPEVAARILTAVKHTRK